MFDTQLYRGKEEVEKWLDKGPVVQLVQWLSDNYDLTAEEVDDMKQRINLEIDAAVAESEQGELEPVSDLLKDVYTEVTHG